MYRIPIAMHNRLMRGEMPIAYAVINTHMGKRVYAEKEMSRTTDNLINGDMELWSAGAAAAPDSWTYTWSGHAGSVARDGATIKAGTYSAAVTCGSTAGDYCYLYQDFQDALGIAYWRGKTVTLGCWAWCAAGSIVRTVLQDATSNIASGWHTGSNNWQWLTTTITVDASATFVRAVLYMDYNAVHVAYFDQAILYENYLETSARVLSFGSFERTSQPIKDDVLTAYSGKQLQHMSIQLDNADRYFSRLIAKEPFLGRNLSIYVGFEAEAEATHIRLFSGTISEVSIGNTLTIEAEEA